MYKYYKDIATESRCTGCMACVDSCNKNAIFIVEVGGILFPKIDTSKCIECGLCKKICPSLNKSNSSSLKQTKVFAVWSKNDEIRLNAASGGFCTQLGLEIIKRGGFVATVVMKDNKPEYILTNKVEELLLGSNSKYVQGNPSGIYSKVKGLLNLGTEVLFNGLPCYCAGLKNYLRKDYSNLITVELVCSAPPSNYAVNTTLNIVNGLELKQFRKKITGGMWGGEDHSLIIDDKLINKTSSPFYNIFASMMTARVSCMDCQFAQMKRIADFTVADFHGYRCAGYEKGVSLVITNNPKAVDILTHSQGLFVLRETWVKAINSNYRLYNGYDFLRYHPGIVFRNKLYGSNVYRKMCLNKHFWRMLWLPFKAFTKIIIKLKHREAIKIAVQLDKSE